VVAARKLCLPGNLLAQTPAKLWPQLRQPQDFGPKTGRGKKNRVSRKKLLRTPAAIRKYPFTEAAVTLQRQTEAAVTPGSRTKTRNGRAVAPSKYGATG